MADDVEMIPVTGAEPPKADPLAKPVADKPATIKLTPVAHKPVPGATPSPALKPGLKLPPKPGFGAGLKLPPKPGAAFKPGLKLPTQAALKPGVKLPPKPVIRKPGATAAAAPLPKPVAPVADLPKPMEALKTVTQKLKGITQEVPQQAVLHKTGIISEGGMSDSQKEAAKHKTARISLSDAMGVAPVKDEAAPMKTIRIKRPIDIPTPTPTTSLAPQPKADAAPAAPAPAAAKPTAPAPAPAAPAPTVTQRKTLKITRPGGVAVRPGGKFGVKRPEQAAAKLAAPSAAASAAAPADGEVPEIADIPNVSAAAPAPVAAAPAVEEGPAWLWTLSTIFQFAACVAIGALAWFLWENTQLPTYCGGLGWGQ